MFLPFVIRFILPGLLVIAFCLGLIGYGKHLESVERDAALLVQEEATKVMMLKQAENLASIQLELEQTRKERDAKVKILHKKVVEYVYDPTQKCVESRSFVELFDALSGVPPRREEMPSSIGATGQPDELPASDPSPALVVSDEPITSAEVMQAYEHAVNALRELEDLYFALAQWVDTDYTIQREAANASLSP